MTQTPDSLVTTANRSATLMIAPATEVIPAPASNAAYAIHKRLVALHYLALVALYGPPPSGVTVRFANIDKPHAPRQPTYFAQLGEMPDPTAVQWFAAFEAGLDRWDEVEMADPLTVIPALDDDGDVHVEVATWETAVIGACRRLKSTERLTELRHLAAHLGPLLPARFNPDSPDFSLPV